MPGQPRFIEIDDPINRLLLDPDNPRLPERLRGADEVEVINWMLADATLLDLMASIAENGFFPGEPIIALQEQGNRFVVIEGNRRLSAIKLLNRPHIANVSPKTVESLAAVAQERNNIPRSVWVFVCQNREEVQNYLGFRHVTGVKQWPVIAKARYLNSLYQQKRRDGNTAGIYRELAKEIGSKATYVKRLLTGYEAYELIKRRKILSREATDEESFDLSLISDALTQYGAIAAYIGIDKEVAEPLADLNLDRFAEVTEWLYERLPNGRTRVGESRNLRLLNKIIQNDDALAGFKEGTRTLQEAAELTDVADENIRLFLQKALQNLAEAQRIVHRSHPDNKDRALAEEVVDSADAIRAVISRRLRERQY
jgi:ParB-like chromosome segregation protein Spo0J